MLVVMEASCTEEHVDAVLKLLDEMGLTVGADGFSTSDLGYVGDRIRVENETGTDNTAVQAIGVI